jgi:hypothetical protein
MPKTTVDAARELVQKGLVVIPVPRGSKSPAIKAWNKLRIAPNDVLKPVDVSTLTLAYSLIDPKAYNRTLMDAIVDANNLIFQKRYRNASWIVVGTQTAARLEKLDEFRLFPAADPVGTIVYGPHLFGTISGRWTVYKDPWLDVTGSGGGPVGGAETMLLGYKGSTPLDTGYVFAGHERS